MRHLVFVYGTLMRGERNHRYLASSIYRGRWRTPPVYNLHSLTSYPVACPDGRQRLSGEVYRISRQTLCQLDGLEEYPLVYSRKLITTPWGPAWLYLQAHAPAEAIPLPSGDWRRRTARPQCRSGFEPVSIRQPFSRQ